MSKWERFKNNVVQLWIAADQLFLNVLPSILFNPCSRHTWADETLSSRCGRLGHRNPYKPLAYVIDLFFLYIWRQGPNHCRNAYEKEKTRYHFPPDMRG